MILPLTLLSLASSFLLARGLSAIHRKGAFLFDDSGDRFYIKGVAYAANYGSSQSVFPSGSISALDPLANAQGCQRDLPMFQQLGINLIRVYQVNASLDHSECMSALSQAGIYVLLDLATPAANDAISSSSPSWNVGLLTNFITTIDAFGSFDNVLGFNVGNEVISSLADDDAAPYIKAATRDVKAYMAAHNYTQLVGYTATDSPNSRVQLADYLACNDTATSIDYWGLNIYEWCGDSTFQSSGYQARTQELQNLSVPAFFSEFGCNAVEPRTFQDVPVLFSSDMTGVWSGGIVFEYQEQPNNFGLVNISADGSSVSPTPDFANLKSAYGSVSPPSMKESSVSSSSSPPSCPSFDASAWPASQNLPPTPNAGVCTCVTQQFACASTFTEATDPGTIGTALGTVCGTSGAQAACAAISGNGTTGVYGDLSHCDPLQALNIALGAYYESQGEAASACDFGGLARVSSAGKPSGTAAVASATSSCIAAGFAAGTGIPSPSAVPPGATTKPLVSDAASATGKHSGAVPLVAAPLAGAMTLGAVVVAMLSGAVMLM